VNTQITFKHLTGSYKDIPGIADEDKCVRMRTEHRMNMTDKGSVSFPTLVRDESHVARVILLSETYEDLTDEHKKLPPVAQDRIMQQHTDDYLARLAANAKIRAMMNLYVSQGEIEIVSDGEIGPNEVLKHKYSIISLSEIAIADHINRNIPIPQELQNVANNPEIERVTKAANEEKVSESKASVTKTK